MSLDLKKLTIVGDMSASAKSALFMGSSLCLALLMAYAPLAASVARWQTPERMGMQAPATALLDAGKRTHLTLNTQTSVDKWGLRASLVHLTALSPYPLSNLNRAPGTTGTKSRLLQLGRLQLEGG